MSLPTSFFIGRGGASGPQNWEDYVAQLPQRLASSNLYGTISASDVSVWLSNGNNISLNYTTIEDPYDSVRHNVIALFSSPSKSEFNNNNAYYVDTRNDSSGRQTAYVTPPRRDGANLVLSEAWVGTTLATELIYHNNSRGPAILSVLGQSIENYWRRPTNESVLAPNKSTMWSRNTQTEGTDWTQNVTVGHLYQAKANTGFSTDKTNGPWSSGHFGPWGWNYDRSMTNSWTLKSSLLQGTTTGQDAISIFERTNPDDPYPPEYWQYYYVLYPDYPCP